MLEVSALRTAIWEGRRFVQDQCFRSINQILEGFALPRQLTALANLPAGDMEEVQPDRCYVHCAQAIFRCVLI